DAIIQREIVLHLVAILPIEIPGVPLPISQRRAKEERCRIDPARGEIGKVGEIELATRRSIQEPAGIFTPNVGAPATGMLLGTEMADQRHIVKDLVGVRAIDLRQVAGSVQSSESATTLDRR